MKGIGRYTIWNDKHRGLSYELASYHARIEGINDRFAADESLGNGRGRTGGDIFSRRGAGVKVIWRDEKKAASLVFFALSICDD